MTATTTIQSWITAKERAATLDYACRSLKTCGGENYCTGAHAAQLLNGKYEAAELLRGDRAQWAAMDAHWIRHALKLAKEALKAAEAEKKAIGTLRQLRLAIGAECDCYGCGEIRLKGAGEYYCAACIEQQQAAHETERAAFTAYHEWADGLAAAA